MSRAHIPILRRLGRLGLDHLVIILIYVGIVVSLFIFVLYICMYVVKGGSELYNTCIYMYMYTTYKATSAYACNCCDG